MSAIKVETEQLEKEKVFLLGIKLVSEEKFEHSIIYGLKEKQRRWNAILKLTYPVHYFIEEIELPMYFKLANEAPF